MRCMARKPSLPSALASFLTEQGHASPLAVADFFQPLAESERRDVRQADAREARALISPPRYRVTAATTAQACAR
jgi:hypothetical protein